MNSYAESKKTLDRIREEFGCKGEILFKSSLQYVLEYGQQNFQDVDWVRQAIDEVNSRHDAAEIEGRNLLIGRNFELALIECARRIAQINSYDILIYVQREIWLSNEGIDPQRAVELLKNCMSIITDSHSETKFMIDDFMDAGFTDDELEFLGYGFLIEGGEEDDY